MEEDFETLKKVLQITEDIKLPTDDIRAHRSPKDCDRYLSDEAKKNLINWYEKDFQFFEISKGMANYIRGQKEGQL